MSESVQDDKTRMSVQPARRSSLRILAVAYDSNAPFGATQSFLALLTELRDEFGVEADVVFPDMTGALHDVFASRGFRVLEGGLSFRGRRFFYPVVSLERDGLDSLRKVKTLVKHLVDLVTTRSLVRIARRSGYDLVYTNTRHPRAGAVVARRLGVPHIVHVREDRFPADSWGFWGNNELVRQSDRIICVSEAVRQRLAEVAPSDNTVTIYNGVDVPLGLPGGMDPEKSGLDLFMGSWLRPMKRHFDALEALKILDGKSIRDVRLHLVGDTGGAEACSEYARELAARMEALGLNDRVFFHGAREDMVAARRGMDCELMCSDFEPFGRVTVEGMRCGLLVIGADGGGTTEILADGVTGLIYERGNPRALAEKIEWVYRNRRAAQRIAVQGYELVQSNFTVARNARDVFAQMIAVVEAAPARLSEIQRRAAA